MSRTKESRRIDRLVENRPKRPPEARKSDENTANTQQVRFFKLYFDFNVFSAENRRLFWILDFPNPKLPHFYRKKI